MDKQSQPAPPTCILPVQKPVYHNRQLLQYAIPITATSVVPGMCNCAYQKVVQLYSHAAVRSGECGWMTDIYKPAVTLHETGGTVMVFQTGNHFGSGTVAYLVTQIRAVGNWRYSQETEQPASARVAVAT